MNERQQEIAKTRVEAPSVDRAIDSACWRTCWTSRVNHRNPPKAIKSPKSPRNPPHKFRIQGIQVMLLGPSPKSYPVRVSRPATVMNNFQRNPPTTCRRGDLFRCTPFLITFARFRGLHEGDGARYEEYPHNFEDAHQRLHLYPPLHWHSHQPYTSVKPTCTSISTPR